MAVRIIRVFPLQLTQHSDSSLARQAAADGPGFTAVHLRVVHLHVVDPQGAVRKQFETRVLEGKMKREKTLQV